MELFMRWTSMVFLAPAAALSVLWRCGGGDTPVVAAPKAHDCGGAGCVDECNLIKKSTTYYTDSACL
jgi:hypothetical protein